MARHPILAEPADRAGVSVWREELPPVGEAASASGAADVVVIGGGLTGLSAAYHVLADNPAARVIVLEAERVGHGASSRNSGMLTPGVGQNLPALVRRFGPDLARELYLQSLDAVEYVGKLLARENIDVGLRMTGQLVVAHGPSGRGRLAQQARLMAELGLPCEQVSETELRQYLRIATMPGRGEGPAALRLPIAGVLNPGRFVAGLSEAIQRRGGVIREGAKVQSVSRGAIVEVTLLDGSILKARHVVVATSGYSSLLNLHRGRLIPLHLRILLTEPLSRAQLAELGWHRREGVIDSRRVFNYFRLTDDDRLLFGGGQPRYLWGGQVTDQPAESPDLNRLAQQLRHLFPSLHDVRIARSWTGVIAYTLDNLPVIGPVPGYERVLFVGGWCGHGIALGTLSGRWVQDYLAGGNFCRNLPWFRQQSACVPFEPLRWLGVRAAGWAMEKLDRY